MKYAYTGMTRQQEKVSGVIDAGDESEARLRLRAMAIRPITVAQKKDDGRGNNKDTMVVKKSGGVPRFTLGKIIDLKGLVVFTRQFSSLIDSGVPVVQCLDILWQQERRPAFKAILASIKENIESGAGLAESLGKFPNVFGEFFIRIVEAGEISGTLDKAIRRVGLQLERLGKIKAKVIGAMIYPLITVVVAIIVLLFLLIKVIPEISKLYGESGAQLPEITVQVMAISNFVQENFLYIIAVVLGIFVGVPALYKIPAFRQVFDPFILRVPAIGDLIKKAAIAQLTRTMSTLITSGVPLINSFEICQKLIGNLKIKESISAAMSSVSEGKTIAQGLAQNQLFPPMVLHMVAIGEMTGKLDDLLGKVADIYDDELDDAVSNVTGLIQPVMIVFVGGIIAFLLIAMYLPIFQLAEKVTGGA